ncbi:hypothetical protein JZ751_016788, partial [Albula glossodonta]
MSSSDESNTELQDEAVEEIETMFKKTMNVPNQTIAPSSSQHTNAEPAFAEDDRSSAVFIQGKGMVMTYMFEEKANMCRYFDAQSGLWLLLPLQWEMNIEFVRTRIQQVMGALPGLGDQKEITAALRQCNYDPDEVISTYLTIFGDVLFQPAQGEQNYRELNSFRYLARESQYLSEVIQHLNRKVAELEADQQEAREKIRALLTRRSTVPPVKPEPKPSVDPGRLQEVSGLTRGLNISNKQLRSTVWQWMEDLQNQMKQLVEAVQRMSQAEQDSSRVVEELRTLYRKEAVERKALYNRLLELQGNIRVFCRCRASPTSTTCLEVTSDEEMAEKVFEGTLPIIASCVDGYNICILAYGQTGSGKTYTMMGPKDKPGVNIRNPINTAACVKTRLNESSRSHLILTLRVDGTDTISGVTSHGTLTLCDLAGSERISKTEAKGPRLLEAASINKSLTALGQVFSALKCNALHVPFRNSKLTHLLQPCLSGDAKACVFVNVSPDAKNMAETLSTLQFGSSIRQVVLGKATQHPVEVVTSRFCNYNSDRILQLCESQLNCEQGAVV